MVVTLSSREFNQDTSGAKRAADSGPVYITDSGRPRHVLLSYEAYERLLGTSSVLDLLAEPRGVEAVEFDPPSSHERPVPATFS